jgi:hypothetical protein
LQCIKLPECAQHSGSLILHVWTEQMMDHSASLFSQGWLATPQLVLHALWQEVWHSPQPPSTAL